MRLIPLAPDRKFAEEVVNCLAEEIRVLPSGAKSLEHLLVIVPTAQSGRRLRRILADKKGPVIAPRVMMPAGLVLPDDTAALSTRTDELVAFTEVLGDENAIEEASLYVELRSALGANALMFRDVAERISDLLKYNPELAAFEEERWRNLANLEEAYLAALKHRNKTDRIVAMQKTLSAPVHLKGIEKIVVAGVLQPLPVMEKALVQTGLCVEYWEPAHGDLGDLPLDRSQITPAGTVMNEAAEIAEIVAGVKNGKDDKEAWPSICLADPDMFPEVQAALRAAGLTVHNPARTSLASSSLGRLSAQLCSFARGDRFDVFSALIRGGDVRRWLQESLSLDDSAYAELLGALDDLQAKVLPEKTADALLQMPESLRHLYDFISQSLRQKKLRQTLAEIFKTLKLSEKDLEAREFISAAKALNALIAECFDDSIPEKLQQAVFMHRLDESDYSPEPDEGDSLTLDGWLELPFLDTEELIIAGFQEGCVPESIAGHAFLPDSLRSGLGLPTNESRTLRDARILAMVLDSRPANAVRILFHSVAANGDVLKPSRLLFRCASDAELAGRAEAFYSRSAGSGRALTPGLPESWRLKLPVPPEFTEIASVSLSALDAYNRCPFTYYLKRVLGEPAEYDAEELAANDFGTIMHQALQNWACGSLKDSEDEDEISRALESSIDNLLVERFGNVPAIVFLQGESMKARLRNFARRQVLWHKDGWRIVGVEEDLRVRYDGTMLRGRADRVDYNENTKQWCVIDYKTWESGRIAKPKKNSAESPSLESFQLPAYAAMLELSNNPRYSTVRRENTIACYCVLGRTYEDVVFSEPFSGNFLPDAEKQIKETLAKLRRGIFWPCSRKKTGDKFEWEKSFSHLMIENQLEKSLDASWIADQERRAGI